jgi:hypothetical protein
MTNPNFHALDDTLTDQPLAAMADADGSLILVRTSEHRKATFRYGLLAAAMVATPTDVIVIQGSATRTLRIKLIKLSGVATAQGNMPVQLVRRSTAGTLGSAVLTAITPAQHDTSDAAATGVVSRVGTANYTTLGTAAGIVGAGRLGMPASGTGATGQSLVWDFATRQDKAVILRGTSDFLCINFNGAAIPAGGVIDVEIEIEEDAS